MAEEKWVGEITKEEAKSRVVRRMTDEEKEILKKINWNLWEIDETLGYFFGLAVSFVFVFGCFSLAYAFVSEDYYHVVVGMGCLGAVCFSWGQAKERKNRIEKHAFRLTQPKEGTK